MIGGKSEADFVALREAQTSASSRCVPEALHTTTSLAERESEPRLLLEIVRQTEMVGMRMSVEDPLTVRLFTRQSRIASAVNCTGRPRLLVEAKHGSMMAAGLGRWSLDDVLDARCAVEEALREAFDMSWFMGPQQPFSSGSYQSTESGMGSARRPTEV